MNLLDLSRELDRRAEEAGQPVLNSLSLPLLDFKNSHLQLQ